jgi:5-methylcytosine-specific restriction endonuclease McrA
MSIEEKIALLIEMEKWYRKKYDERGRIGDISTDSIFPFFEEKNNFKHEPRHCRVCNKQLKGRQIRYCSEKCSVIANMFSWQPVKSLFEGITNNYSCRFCGRNDTEVDHIKPISKGGLEFDLNNLRYLCVHCNRSRKLKHRMVEPPKEVNLKMLFERQKTLCNMEIEGRN